MILSEEVRFLKEEKGQPYREWGLSRAQGRAEDSRQKMSSVQRLWGRDEPEEWESGSEETRLAGPYQVGLCQESGDSWGL